MQKGVRTFFQVHLGSRKSIRQWFERWNMAYLPYLLGGIIWGIGIGGQAVYSQVAEDSLPSTNLKAVTIDALRLTTAMDRTPFSVSVIDREGIQRGNQQMSIHESLVRVPGLFALNQENFAQDLRVSIRGFGSRAAFGIRGVKLIVDGIPESTPDGQAQVDNLDMGIIGRMQVLRGPASGLYGNAAGGVLLLETEEVPSSPFAELRYTAGSYNFQRFQLKTGFQEGKVSGVLYGANTTSDGYRSHSEMANSLLNAKIQFDLDSVSDLTLYFNFVNSSRSNDPGGVDSTSFVDNPRDARQRNIDFDAGEALTQGRIALKYQRQLSRQGQLSIRGYHLQRDFANKLPFGFGGMVSIARKYSGGGIGYTHTGTIGTFPSKFSTGLDVDYQADARTRFRNNEGVRGDLTFDQLESFFSAGLYAIEEIYFHPRFSTSIGARFDAVRLGVEDRFLGNGDDSGSLNFQQINPMIGLVFSAASALNVYANLSTSFETPTLSELSANPSGGGGFNPDLAPQRATNMEVGIKGTIANRFRYALTGFNINVFDELVPYELADFPDREFFRNAGQSSRLGAEMSLQANLATGLQATASYTWNQFQYEDYLVVEERFDGHVLPGIPQQVAYLGLQYAHSSGFFANIWGRRIGEIYANDANTVKIDPYTLLQLRLAWTLSTSWGEWEPFFGVNNVLDQQYAGNVRINAFGGRYYEAAATRNIFGGVRIRLSKS
ncbi:MAG: TonB-dependent receptor [Bacteroidota bacterium]